MSGKRILEDLWRSAGRGSGTFGPKSMKEIPEGARNYFQHSILPGTPLALGARLRMHGEIRLSGWLPLSSEQVILGRGEMVWTASVRKAGIPITGYDRLTGGRGEMRWKALGIIPVVTASGDDVTRSATGRLAAEFVWLPSVLLSVEAEVSEDDPGRISFFQPHLGQDSRITVKTDDEGRPLSVRSRRWGDPAGQGYGLYDFGAVVEGEETFGGYTIPSRLRAGWFFGTDRFESEGEFFRVTLDDAIFR